MKKIVLAVIFIASAAFFLSCSNGSSDSGSESTKASPSGSGTGTSSNSTRYNFNPVLFEESEVPVEVTTGSITLSVGKWKCTEFGRNGSVPWERYFDYTVNDSSILCTKRTEINKFTMDDDRLNRYKRMSRDEVLSVCSPWNPSDYYFDGNDLCIITITEESDSSIYSRDSPTIQFNRGYYSRILTNTDNTKYKLIPINSAILTAGFYQKVE